MRKYLQIIDRNRASKWKRLANFVVDRLIFNLIILSIGFAGGLIDRLLDQYYFTEIFLEYSEIARFWDIIITSLIYVVYMFFKIL